MIFLEVTPAAGQPPLREWIAEILQRDRRRQQQSAHLPRVARVLRRPNLAATRMPKPFGCRCCGARFEFLGEFYGHVIRCRPTERDLFDATLSAMRAR